MRAVPSAALALVKRFESFRATRYSDTGGLPTIGYGHKISVGDPLWNATISEETAEQLARSDLETAASELQTDLGDTLLASLTDNQWSALLDFVFNEGIGRFETSTLASLIKRGDLAGVGAQFDRWVYGQVDGEEVQLPGLVARRAAETALWQS